MALISGTMLFWPSVMAAQSGGGLTPAAAVQLINRERAVVIDVCEANEFAAGHVSGAKHIALGTFADKLEGAVKNKALPLILVCASGARASKALGIAKGLGYENAKVLGGGLKSWREANLPVDKS